MNSQLMVQFLLIFILTNALGIVTAFNLMEEGVQATIVTDNPDDVENSVGLFVWVLVFTGFLLVLILFVRKGWLYWIFKGLESIAVLGASFFVFDAFIGSTIALMLALFIVGLRLLFREHLWLRNVSSILATAGAGALIGVSLGVIPVIVFLVLLGVYDYIAVFKTKHMVKLAKPISTMNLSFTYAIPTKKHKFELGTGDLVMPLMFGVSVLDATHSSGVAFPFTLVPTLMVLLGSLGGLMYTLQYSDRHRGKPLPALPLQVIFMLVLYAGAKLAGF